MNLKILHCPTTVGGNPQGLCRAERSLGFDSRSTALVQNYFNYPVDEVVIKTTKPTLLDEGRVWLAAAKSLARYDVLHYNFGQSFTPVRNYPHTNSYPKWKVFLYSDIYARFGELLDVKVANLLNKVVAVTYQGDDARQGGYCDANYDIHPGKEFTNGYYNADTDRFKRKRIEIFDRHADLIYALNPDLMNVLPARTKFMAYASVDPREWTPIYSEESVPAIPHIVHAPSNRLFKGTRFIQDALNRLENEGIKFRYTFVEGMSNAEARKIYETTDLLIDQVLAGYYGGLAVELMALGKPVVCYLREEDMRHLPPGMWNDMPIINARPDTIYDVLKEYLTIKKHSLREIGAHSRQYVEKWHDPVKIAKNLTDDYVRVAKEKNLKAVK
jgi:hypothetical protein